MRPALGVLPVGGGHHPPRGEQHPQVDAECPTPMLTWLESPGGTARSVLLSTSPMRNSDTLQGQRVSTQRHMDTHVPQPTPQAPELTCC